MSELVEVSSFGDPEPRFLLAGWPESELTVARARALFLAGELELDQFEQQVGEALKSPAKRPFFKKTEAG